MYRLLIPIDDDEDRALRQARFVTDQPYDLSEAEAVLTHVMHGREKDAPKSMQHPGRVASVKRAREYLEDHGVEVTTVEASAPPEDGIIELVDEVDADHVVMGGRKRSPAGKAVFGSVTQTVILKSDVPVTVTG
ncbi:universal stress protein [Haloferax sp. MBLA0076]|uniref:Universal stress protein n=1 Tax=Haloferax litoreum TaxID=2666140 RepID=A0A6A8GHE9_9EURY|nr:MULTISPECIES: universal stress protein [Haloferax]KAB1194053.1 universal stress protein [Haloferax sp. CBA1148]MRX22603.1 universal stress protein [Haloferax litoreum]